MTAATSAHLDGDKFVMQVYKAHVTKMRENLAHEAESKENFEEGETAEQYMERQEQEIGEAEEMIEGCIQLEASIRDKMAECMEDAKRIRGMQRSTRRYFGLSDRVIGAKGGKIEFMIPTSDVGFWYTDKAPEFKVTFNAPRMPKQKESDGMFRT
ncbi:unnamed protein product, partial [Mesorhabditis spiculigera]